LQNIFHTRRKQMKKSLYIALMATQTYAFTDALTGFYVGGSAGFGG